MSPWDCAPFPVILREAGGYFGDWSGRETIHTSRSLATTAALLPELLDILRGDTDED
jgi:myo-inositol-1(or 4)-monophosphatase